MISVIMDAIGYSIEDSGGTILIREDTHGLGSPSHLPGSKLRPIV
jgi:hypothetical protein